MSDTPPNRPEQPDPQPAQGQANPHPASPSDRTAESSPGAQAEPGFPGAPGEVGPGAAPGQAPDTFGGGGNAQLADAEARSAEYMEMFLRTRAELENFRKRAQADVAAAHKYAIESFAESLLPVKDSLEMALKVDTPTVENLQEGVNATLRLMAAAFDKHKLLEIEPVGEKFDPNRHQAISMVPASDVPANHVVSVLQKGYLINDRVLRPALVTVRSGT
jgi:molecular chaperone GrpE